MLNTLRKTKCREANRCNCFSKESFTCIHNGGNYCGIYRYVHDKPKHMQPIDSTPEETVFIVNPPLHEPINC